MSVFCSQDTTVAFHFLAQTEEQNNVGVATLPHDPPFALKVLLHLLSVVGRGRFTHIVLIRHVDFFDRNVYSKVLTCAVSTGRLRKTPNTVGWQHLPLKTDPKLPPPMRSPQMMSSYWLLAGVLLLLSLWIPSLGSYSLGRRRSPLW
jgi:hypothetical protein